MRLNHLAAAGFAAVASAQGPGFVSFSPEGLGITYSVSIPETTANSGSGPIYFKLSGPATYQWIAMGFGGPNMQGTNIFVMYPSDNGNVTVSPRSGVGEVMPRFNPETRVTLLSESGIINGQMVANVRCDNCETWQQTHRLSFGGQQQMIHAHRTGQPPLNTANQQARLTQHNQDGQPFMFDFTQAVTQSNTNPLLTNNPATSGGSGSVGSTAQESSESRYDMYWKSHGVLMGLSVVVLFPLGAIMMRVCRFKGLWLAHASVQVTALILLTAGFGIGVWLAKQLDLLYKDMGHTHTIFGTTLFAFFWIQPFGGLIAHYMFTKERSRTLFGHAHAWFGRAILILGIVNGGLGLKLADNTTGGKIAYGVIAGIIGLIYITVVLFMEIRNMKRSKQENREVKGDMSQTS